MTQLHGDIEDLAKLLELMGVAIILLGVAVATGLFLAAPRLARRL